MYDAKTGRFLGRDPLDYLDGSNCYKYVRGKPLKYEDPLGLIPPEPIPVWHRTLLSRNCVRFKGRYILATKTVPCADQYSLKGEWGFKLSLDGKLTIKKLGFGVNLGWDAKVAIEIKCVGPPGAFGGYKICEWSVPYEYDHCVSEYWVKVYLGARLDHEYHETRVSYHNLKVDLPDIVDLEVVPCKNC